MKHIDNANLDNWIDQLRQCKPLEEIQVKLLCEKVKFFI